VEPSFLSTGGVPREGVGGERRVNRFKGHPGENSAYSQRTWGEKGNLGSAPSKKETEGSYGKTGGGLDRGGGTVWACAHKQMLVAKSSCWNRKKEREGNRRGGLGNFRKRVHQTLANEIKG